MTIRLGSNRRSLLAYVSMALATTVATLPAAASAESGRRPSIAKGSASEVTQTDATLTAQIDPHGLETEYYVRVRGFVECTGDPPLCLPLEIIREFGVAQGSIPATATSTLVSVELANAPPYLDLDPGTRLEYWVLAHNAAGTRQGPTKSFTTLEAEGPTIVSESVSHLTEDETRATVKASINPGGLETKYEFWVNFQPCLYLDCEIFDEDPELRGEGTIAAGDTTVKVHAKLTGLLGDAYEYWVLASNSGGTDTGAKQDFPKS